ncbi:MAG: DUF6516 family protein [Candidatus Korobacteraceae bacterium]
MPDISCQDMNGRAAKDYVLENLLGYDGRTHHFEKGYWLKFEFKRVPETSQRPHGLDYSLTLHAPDGTRLLGFDNAHPVPAKGSRFKKPPQQSDHWHRTETDPGRPYEYQDAAKLVEDFLNEAERILAQRGVSTKVIGEK